MVDIQRRFLLGAEAASLKSPPNHLSQTSIFLDWSQVAADCYAEFIALREQGESVIRFALH
jgi:hypothetical protein